MQVPESDVSSELPPDELPPLVPFELLGTASTVDIVIAAIAKKPNINSFIFIMTSFPTMFLVKKYIIVTINYNKLNLS